MGLQTIPFTLTKVIQLYETKNSRHSTMIVGCTGSGKTASWRILQSSLSSLCRAGEPNFNIVRVRTWDSGATGGDLSSRKTVRLGAGVRRCLGGWCRPGGRPGRDERDRGQIQIPGNKGTSWDLCQPAAQNPLPVSFLGVPFEP